MDREAWHTAVHGLQRTGHDWVTELNWLSEQKWTVLKLGNFKLETGMKSPDMTLQDDL